MVNLSLINNTATKVINLTRRTKNKINFLRSTIKIHKSAPIDHVSQSTIKQKVNSNNINNPVWNSSIKDLTVDIDKLCIETKRLLELNSDPKNNKYKSYIEFICDLNKRIKELVDSRNDTKYDKIEKFIEDIDKIIRNTLMTAQLFTGNSVDILFEKTLEKIDNILLINPVSINNSIKQIQNKKSEKEEEKQRLSSNLQTKINRLNKPSNLRSFFSKSAKNAYNLRVQKITNNSLATIQNIDIDIRYLDKKLHKLQKSKNNINNILNRQLMETIPRKDINFLDTDNKKIENIISDILRNKPKKVMDKLEGQKIILLYNRFLDEYLNLILFIIMNNKYRLNTLNKLKTDRSSNEKLYKGVKDGRNRISVFARNKIKASNSIIKSLELKLNSLYPTLSNILTKSEERRKENINKINKNLQLLYSALITIINIPTDFFKILLIVIDSKKNKYKLQLESINKRILEWKEKYDKILGKYKSILPTYSIEEQKEKYNRNFELYSNQDSYIQYINDTLEKDSLEVLLQKLSLIENTIKTYNK